ncbi:MAG: transporter ATP-binding protein [Ignavibacteria bacterium]|nr:transporter ATP-binding protein [Ignavibacteria bacterium]
MIRLASLSKTYNMDSVRVHALNGISLEIDSGEFVAIMGPSGCGKSTLLNILGLLDRPSSGKYYFNDKEIGSSSEFSRAKFRKNNIGFIFQNFNLIEYITVFENIELPLKYRNFTYRERKTKVNALLERFGILDKKKVMPSYLSGGEQQRVAVARAIAVEPALILADEPTGNLDSANGKAVLDYLVEINQNGTTIIMVTHEQEYALYAGRTINLLDGRVVNYEL